jgi:hypothetical protein
MSGRLQLVLSFFCAYVNSAKPSTPVFERVYDAPYTLFEKDLKSVYRHRKFLSIL